MSAADIQGTTSQPNFSTCCRLCLRSESSSDRRSIFGKNTDDRMIRRQILAALGIEITNDDKVSTKVCVLCIDKIHNWNLFKESCVENQTTLDQWLLQLSNTTPVHIKEEPIDRDDSEVATTNLTRIVKREPVDVDYNELPPLLTPHIQDEEMGVEVVANALNVQIHEDIGDPTKTCRFCQKTFSSRGNKKKHEKLFHKEQYEEIENISIGSMSQDENRSQSSIDSQDLEPRPEVSQDIPTRPPAESSDENKILFAAGLKLLRRNSVTPPISQDSLSKIELSYIEKCKAMVEMHRTLKCACHNAKYSNLKGLFTHLRALRIWFPVFTCYHCMVTLTDRSAMTRHYLNCPKSNLETLIKMSNLRKRSEVKTRLYQLYKCTKCKFMYSFHEDFCGHVDDEHSNIDLPHTCSCGRVFDTLEGYKDHVYVSCLVDYYCDICFVTHKTVEAFQKHAVEIHDNSEGFVLLQDDDYRPRTAQVAATRSGVKREHTDVSNIITTKRRSSYKPPILDSDDENSQEDKEKIPGTVCPICQKEYSSNNNMNRHYKTHTQNDIDESMYSCPDCSGMYSAVEWIKHKEQHDKKTCNECGKVFQFQTELDQHRSVHLNLKLYRESPTQAYKSTATNGQPETQIFKTASVSDSSSSTKNFFCKPCNKVYQGYSGLWDHNKRKHPEIRTAQGNYPKQCNYCDKILYTGGSYYNHKQKHEREEAAMSSNQESFIDSGSVSNKKEGDDGESYYTCKRCFKVFGTKSVYRSHMKSHGIILSPPMKKPNKKVWCDICHRSFDSSAHLDSHKSQEHSDLYEETEPLSDNESEAPFVLYTCDVCVQTFSTKAALIKHKEKHAREIRPIQSQMVYCKYCKIAFKNAIILSNHIRDKHPEVNGLVGDKAKSTYRCGVCGKCFGTQAARHAHMGWHSRPKGLMQPPPLLTIKQEPGTVPAAAFKCATCNAVLQSDTALQIHILEKHRNVNAIVLAARCNTCNLDFATQEEFEQHKVFHSSNSDGQTDRFNCSFCKSTFNRVDRLKAHVRQYHKPDEHRCPECDRVFEKANALAIHLKVHSNERSKMIAATTVRPLYACSICNCGFELPKDLRTHTIEAHPF